MHLGGIAAASPGVSAVPALDLAILQQPIAAVAAGGIGVLATGLVLGFRHGFDWDHIAAITDTSYPTARWRLHRARGSFSGSVPRSHSGAGERARGPSAARH